MKALVSAFNQEKALVGSFSVIVKTGCGTDGSFYSTNFGTCAEDAFLANTLDNVQVTDIAHCVALIIHYFVMVFILQQ